MRTAVPFIRIMLALFFASFAAAANSQTYRIGALWAGSQKDGLSQAFVQQLEKLGYQEGKNLVIESLYADWNPARFSEMAKEMVRRKPDLIFAPTRGAAEAAKNATHTIPIVFALAPDPVAEGLVASLARPGGNVTGSSNIQTGLTAKRVQLLQEVIPRVNRVGLIYDAADKVARDQADEVRKTAMELKIQLYAYEANKPAEYQRAFDALAKRRAQAVFITGSVTSYNQAKAIAELALKYRLPTMNADRKYVEEGGLLSYGVDILALYRKAATYVDRILKGAKPADLPVEQADRYETLINMKTARALGLDVPRPLLTRIDQVIE